MSSIILYDLPSKGRCACWSLNPWKTRLALNYKGVDYETQWTEYPDVAPLFKSFGIPPNEEGMPYTIPTVRLNGDHYVMESREIAAELEKMHPTPSLHLDAPVLAEVQAVLPKVAEPLRPVWMPRVPVTILRGTSSEGSKEYFERTRAEKIGMPLEQFAKEKGGEECWETAKGPMRELAALLEKEGGPFFMGGTVSYADFMVVGMLRFFKILGLYDRIVSLEPALGKLYDASGKWLERDDH